MMHFIDHVLDGITMYKIILYGLLLCAFTAILLGFFGLVPYRGYQYIVSFAFLLATCWVSNYVFAKLYNIPTNSESSLITGLILFFLLTPFESSAIIPTYVLAGIFSMASKYLLSFCRKHVFNPAALTAVFLDLLGSPFITWWVGSAAMLPFITILGFLILRKLRRFSMFFTFAFFAILTTLLFGMVKGHSVFSVLPQIFLSFPLIFFGTVMVTEPLTTPPTNMLRLFYGGVVGVLFGSQFSIGPVFSSPELSLVIGNVYSYFVSPKEKFLLFLKEKRKIAADMYEFIFVPRGNLSYKAGQYMEWTLGHAKVDIRPSCVP